MGMTDEPEVAVTIAQGVKVQLAPDGIHTALAFNTGNPPTLVGLTPKDLSYLISAAIETAAKAASIHAPVAKGQEFLTTRPIPTVSIGVARGRSASEALLAMQVGTLTLTYAVDLAMLQKLCTDLHSMTQAVGQKKPN
jgi:hypothetical protein